MSQKCHPSGEIARPRTETLKAKTLRTMLGRMLLLALNDHNGALFLSKLGGRSRRERRNECSEVANVRFGSLGMIFRRFCAGAVTCPPCWCAMPGRAKCGR